MRRISEGAGQRVTRRNILKALSDLGYKDVEMHKGNGYFYFTGGIADNFTEQGVYGVFNLTDITLDRWIFEFQTKVEDIR